ncbi:MAG: thimet oligopeptidase [Alteromonas naphthalenivorans]|jgi:thimet oligopeptidase
MKKTILVVGTLTLCALTFFIKSERNVMMPRDRQGHVYIKTLEDVYTVYPNSITAIQERAKFTQDQSKKIIDAIIAVPHNKQNKKNMLEALDNAYAYFGPDLGIFELIMSVHPDKAMRDEAAKQDLAIKGFLLEHLSNNISLYEAFKGYDHGNATQEEFSPEEHLALDELIGDFKRSGLELPEDKRVKIVELNKKLQKISQQFSQNINNDASSITATKQQLTGVSDDFVGALKKNDAGEYILVTDYPTANMILSYCKVEDTRKRFSKAFKNKAYPSNSTVLKDLMDTRHELAKALDFKSYAHLDLDSQMVKTPERARKFQLDMKDKLLKKSDQEFKEFTKDLPEGVSLTKAGKLESWNGGYVSTYFKKKYYDVDEQKIAEYFPMEQTVRGLLDIYEKFFDLNIETIDSPQSWHPDVRLAKISDKNGPVRGYVFLDMFPRPNKYGHAAMFPGVTTVERDGAIYPTVTTVVCNFTKPTADKPSLLKFDEVNTFFHEFGHAIHGVLGTTKLAAQSGTSVKTDFVELPSQLLENWMENKEILQGLTHHYKTSIPMPDELIDKKLAQIKFGQGMRNAQQMGFGLISLDCFGQDEDKDPEAIFKKHSQEFSPHGVYDTDTHSICSFGHLSGYGAKYYGYMWSRVFADDVFAQVEKEGLLNPKAGKRYVEEILGRGGSKDPDAMLRDYLGREPNSDAFFKKIGL